MSTETNVPPFLPNTKRECKGRQQDAFIAENNTVASEKGEEMQAKVLKTKVRITLSTDSRPDLSTVVSDSSIEETRSYGGESVMPCPSTTNATITVKDDDEERLKDQAKAIVERVIDDAKKKVNFRTTKEE